MSIQFDENGKPVMPEPTGPLDEDNIVFKCNWNDRGWKEICSRKARNFNVSKNKKWCCDKRNDCEELIKKGEKFANCYESKLFVDFVMGAGSYLKGEKGSTMEEKHVRGASKNKLAFLTTIAPGTEEKDKYFIGIFDIEKIEGEHDIHGNKDTSIVVTPKIKIKYWSYKKNKDGSTFWGSGLVRYIDDAIALKILLDLKKEYDKLKGFDKEKKNLDILIKRYKRYIEG